jgi:type IV secretion system protein VirD4
MTRFVPRPVLRGYSRRAICNSKDAKRDIDLGNRIERDKAQEALKRYNLTIIDKSCRVHRVGIASDLRNPLVDAATSDDSFDLRDLRKKRISLYIGVRPADLERLQLILNLLFQQIIDLNTHEMPEDNPALRCQLLLLMDEFTAVGRMPIFAKAISFLGGYNIRPFIIVQGMSQLRATYGVDVAETILTCCAALVVFAPKDQKHANEISESLGDMTVKAKSQSHRVMQSAGGSVTASDHARRLLKPQEVKEIGQANEIIFLENLKPIFCSKVIYWKEQVFMRRKQPAAVVSQIAAHVHQRMQPIVNTPPVSLRVRRPNQEPTR